MAKRKNGHLTRDPKRLCAGVVDLTKPLEQQVPKQIQLELEKLDVFKAAARAHGFLPPVREVSDAEADFAFDAERERRAFGRGGR